MALDANFKARDIREVLDATHMKGKKRASKAAILATR